MNYPQLSTLVFTAFFILSSALQIRKSLEPEVVVDSNDSSVLQPVSFSPNKSESNSFSKEKATKGNTTAANPAVKDDLSDTKLGLNAASNSGNKNKLPREQFRQKILAYCKRYLPQHGQHCVAQSKKSLNGEQRNNTHSSKLDSPEKREIKQQPVDSNPQAEFCASYNMYCRRFLLYQPKLSMQGASKRAESKTSSPQAKSLVKLPGSKSRAITSLSQTIEATSTPQTSRTTFDSYQPLEHNSNFTVQQATAHLKTATLNTNVKVNVTVEEKPQLAQPRQPEIDGPDSSKNSKNSSQSEDFDRRSAPLVLPPPIPNAASDADALFLDSPLKSHVKKALDADLGAAPSQNQGPPKIMPVVVVPVAGADAASPKNAAGTVAGLLGKAGGVKDPTCTADCTAPHCTTECKCANTHHTVEGKCNPPSNGDLTNMCQAWYEKCPMYKPTQFA